MIGPFWLLSAFLAAPIGSCSVPGVKIRSPSTYNRTASIFAQDFFSHFTTYAGPDPTHGYVNYIDKDLAWTTGLINVTHNDLIGQQTAYIGVDHENKTSNGRNSVRLTSVDSYSVGALVVFDVVHVPAAWGQWSAFWLLGSDGVWPDGGEIDIFESVHQSPYNTITLHTSPGCFVDNPQDAITSKLSDTNCNNAGNAADGCSFRAPETVLEFNDDVSTAGDALNQQGGAVVVAEWTNSGISVWMFSRSAVPATLNTLSPSTDDFPTPLARFSGPGCDYASAFRKMQLIINIDLCGDWAGKVWTSSGAAQATNVSTCEQFVADNPQALSEAYFEFASLQIYSSS